MVTRLQILDGQTAVLGGLLREDTQEIHDKVPVLGDLPLVGRLFQSKVSSRIKKNLLIFVTARLIKSNGSPSTSTPSRPSPTSRRNCPNPKRLAQASACRRFPPEEPNS